MLFLLLLATDAASCFLLTQYSFFTKEKLVKISTEQIVIVLLSSHTFKDQCYNVLGCVRWF